MVFWYAGPICDNIQIFFMRRGLFGEVSKIPAKPLIRFILSMRSINRQMLRNISQ